MIRSLWYTNAPQVYDYGYVEEIAQFEWRGEIWREILVSDEDRFRTYQVPRYYSGLYIVHPPEAMKLEFVTLKTENEQDGSDVHRTKRTSSKL